MFTLELIINPIVLLVAGVFGIIIGYILARGMLARAKSTITKLEAELRACYAETLEAQKAYIELEARLQDRSIPVIPMNINGKEVANDKFGNDKFGNDKFSNDKFGTDKFGKDKSSKGKATS
jgi:hypothetical protein